MLSTTTCASESTAVGDLRAINYAQTEYEQTHPESGYASTLVELRAAELIDETLATGSAHDYEFALIPGQQQISGRLLSYKVTAEPAHRFFSRCPGLSTDESGVITPRSRQ